MMINLTKEHPEQLELLKRENKKEGKRRRNLNFISLCGKNEQM